MKVDINIETVNERYEVTISVARVTNAENDKINQFGEPLVDIGGTFTGNVTRPGAGSPTAVNFTLPAAPRRLVSDFPVKHVFDLQDTADADVQAKFWADTVRTRMGTALTNLLAKTTPFVGETGYTLP